MIRVLQVLAVSAGITVGVYAALGVIILILTLCAGRRAADDRFEAHVRQALALTDNQRTRAEEADDVDGLEALWRDA